MIHIYIYVYVLCIYNFNPTWWTIDSLFWFIVRQQNPSICAFGRIWSKWLKPPEGPTFSNKKSTVTPPKTKKKTWHWKILYFFHRKSWNTLKLIHACIIPLFCVSFLGCNTLEMEEEKTLVGSNRRGKPTLGATPVKDGKARKKSRRRCQFHDGFMGRLYIFTCRWPQ